MFAPQLTQKYFPALDKTMRQVVSTLPDETGFGVMIRYALGWVDQNDEPYNQQTGKRIRPTLLWLATESAGGDWQRAAAAAAAVELLHNFSLIHDDIQDDSPTRHGRPTVWKVWGRANAINAGDAMFTLAYSALERLSDAGVDAERILKVWRIFNAMALDLTRGQHLDMRFEQQTSVTVDEYISMIQGKSAALIAACAQIGAIIASGNDGLAKHYADFGTNLGIAFQIRDDILGIWGESEVTGKSAATDILAQKKSLPVLFGLSKSKKLQQLYTEKSFSDAEVSRAIKLLDDVGANDYAQSTERIYYQRALDALESANPEGQAADGLMELVHALFGRAY